MDKYNAFKGLKVFHLFKYIIDSISPIITCKVYVNYYNKIIKYIFFYIRGYY